MDCESDENREQPEDRELDHLADKAKIAAIALERVEQQCDGNRGKRREQQDPDERHNARLIVCSPLSGRCGDPAVECGRNFGVR